MRERESARARRAQQTKIETKINLDQD